MATGMKAYYIHEVYRALLVLARRNGAVDLDPESWGNRRRQLECMSLAKLEKIAGELQRDAGTAA
jgi:CRISPR/Cas system-associated protein Csm6